MPKKKVIGGRDRKMRHEVKVANKVIEILGSFEHQFKNRMATLVISAFGLVAALVWNDAVREIINLIVPVQEVVTYKVIAAIVVTVIAVLITVLLSKPSK